MSNTEFAGQDSLETKAAAQPTADQAAPSTSSSSVSSKISLQRTCPECGRVFLKLAHLIRHVRTHGDERPFSCDKCDKAFARTDALQRHGRSVHGIAIVIPSEVLATANRTSTGHINKMPVDMRHDADQSRPTKRIRKKDNAIERSDQSESTSTSSSEENPNERVGTAFSPDFRQLFGLDNLDTTESRLPQPPYETPEAIPQQRFAAQSDQSHTHTTQSDQFEPIRTAVSMPALTNPSYNTSNIHVTTSAPISSFLASFPSTLSAATASIDASLDHWLTQEGGSHAAENALEMVFASASGNSALGVDNPNGDAGGWGSLGFASSNQSDAGHAGGMSAQFFSAPTTYETPSASTNLFDNSLSHLFPLDFPFEDSWPASSAYTPQVSFPREQLPGNSQRGNLGSNAVGSFAIAEHSSNSSNTTSGPIRGMNHSQSMGGLPSIPRSGEQRLARFGRLTTDTWLNAMGHSEDGVVEKPRPDITSPEQVIGELSVETSIEEFKRKHSKAEEETAIPSMKFLDSCLHLYFRDFHPTFPILHKPTFSRHRSSPLLLLSMCSIGCIFMGTQAAREKGLWIYERLHHVIVFSRDSKMATEEARISMTLSGLLGQCFSFLYGQPKHMFTAESFHGCLVTFARRAGLYRLIDQNKITYDHVANLSDQALEDRWRGWARREMLRRVVFGLALHAADLATYSLLPRILPMQLSINDHSSDALFEAEDASRWRWILLLFSNNSPGSAPSKLSPRASPTVDTFFPISVMAQKIVNTIQLKEMSRSEAGLSSYIADLTGFYKDMQNLANAFDIFPPLGSSMSDSAISVGFRRQQRVMSVLWHYCCLLRLAKLDELEEVAGREGPPQSHALDAVKSWVRLPHARLATLHCAHILHHATDLRDLAFIVPRAIFQAVLVLLCYVAYTDIVPEGTETFDAITASEWLVYARIVENPDAWSGSPEPRHSSQSGGTDSSEKARCWLQSNNYRWRLEGFLDAGDKQMEYVSLLSSATRLLRRCTPWGIGDAMGDILAAVNLC